jgi:hypothetical protein
MVVPLAVRRVIRQAPGRQITRELDPYLEIPGFRGDSEGPGG